LKITLKREYQFNSGDTIGFIPAGTELIRTGDSKKYWRFPQPFPQPINFSFGFIEKNTAIFEVKRLSFTPGPWKLNKNYGIIFSDELSKGGDAVAMIASNLDATPAWSESQDANTRLILKAPDLHRLLVEAKGLLTAVYDLSMDKPDPRESALLVDQINHVLAEVN
jgi:hypothetical protein